MILNECREIIHPLTVTTVAWMDDNRIGIKLAADFTLYLTEEEAYSLLTGLENTLSR